MTLEGCFSSLNFASSYLQEIATNQTYPTDVLFTEETTFTRLGTFNIHNAPLWALHIAQ